MPTLPLIFVEFWLDGVPVGRVSGHSAGDATDRFFRLTLKPLGWEWVWRRDETLCATFRGEESEFRIVIPVPYNEG